MAADAGVALPEVDAPPEWTTPEKIQQLRSALVEWDTAPSGGADGKGPNAEFWPSWAHSSKWDQFDLRRFLIARKGDVEAATRMLTRHIQWRVQECGGWAPTGRPAHAPLDAPLRTAKAYQHGWDRQGRAVVYIHAGRHIVADTTPEENQAVVTLLCEQAVRGGCCATAAAVTASGGVLPQKGAEPAGEAVYPPGQFIGIIDCSELGWSSMDQGILNTMLATLSRNYPERLGRLVILNEGWAFWILWKVIEGLLDVRVREKIEFLGTEYSCVSPLPSSVRLCNLTHTLPSQRAPA